MADYKTVLSNTSKLFYEVLDNTSIPNWVEFELISNNGMKDLYQVKKLSELFEFITQGKNIAVIINEDVFDELPLDMQIRIIEEALSGVVVDDNDRIKLQPFDFTTYSGFLGKYGADDVIKLKETIASIFEAKKAKEEEEKAEAILTKKKR